MKTTWREEIIWAAGLFDGEGHVRVQPSGQGAFALAITQADRQVLDRFRDAVGLGTIYGPTILKNPKHQPRYDYRITDTEGVQAVVAMLWDFLSPPKRQQAAKAFRTYRESGRRQWRAGVCSNGHRKDESNTKITNWGKYQNRRCLICSRAYFRDYTRKYRRERKVALALLSA